MTHSEFVQPIRGVVFDDNDERFGALSDQFTRLGGQVVFAAADIQAAESLLSSNLIRPETVDVAFIGSYGRREDKAGDHILDLLLRKDVVRQAVGTQAIRRASYGRHSWPIVTVGMCDEIDASRAYGSYSEYLHSPLVLKWTEPDLNMPPVLLEVMHMKPARSPRASTHVHIDV